MTSAILENPMSSRFELRFQSTDETKLYAQIWEQEGAKAHLVICHGQGEHSGSYLRVVEALKGLPMSIFALDLRGHGKSEGLRGFAESMEPYVQDLESFISLLSEDRALFSKPVMLLGHSMGGLTQTLTLLRNPQWNIRSLILSSPLFGLSKEVPAVKAFGSLALNLLAPQVTLWNQITLEDCTSDPEVIEELAKDVYRHDKISAGVFLGFYTAWKDVFEKLSTLKVPLLLQISNKDPVVSTPRNLEFYKLYSGKKELKEYKNRKHEIYNDLGREEVLKDLAAFVEKNI